MVFILLLTPGKTSEALNKLMDLQASMAILLEMSPVLEPGSTSRVIGERDINTNLLKRDDIIKVCFVAASISCVIYLPRCAFVFWQVLRGSKVPVDGVIVQGSTTIDESMITG